MDIRAHSDLIRDKALEGRKYIKITAAPVKAQPDTSSAIPTRSIKARRKVSQR
jgi:hypothetical protein